MPKIQNKKLHVIPAYAGIPLANFDVSGKSGIPPACGGTGMTARGFIKYLTSELLIALHVKYTLSIHH
jgi:hypothetical protein